MRDSFVNFGDVRLPDRFWSKVSPCPMSGCWIWIGSIQKLGYATFGVGSRTDDSARIVYAHRLAFELTVGDVEDGLELDHLCRVRCCVNPGHLEAVTHVENVRRSTVGSVQAARTHCPRGHEYAGANLYVHPNGSRHCRTCKRAAGAAWKSKQSKERTA